MSGVVTVVSWRRSVGEVVAAAWLVVEDVEALVAAVGAEDPDRVQRPGWRRLVERAERLRDLLERATDPGVNVCGVVRAGARDTERAAAVAVLPRTGTVRRAVLDVVAAAGDVGVTHQELERALDGVAAASSVRTRCSELVAAGWVVDSGRRRKTDAGLDATVWVVSERAKVKFGLGDRRNVG